MGAPAAHGPGAHARCGRPVSAPHFIKGDLLEWQGVERRILSARAHRSRHCQAFAVLLKEEAGLESDSRGTLKPPRDLPSQLIDSEEDNDGVISLYGCPDVLMTPIDSVPVLVLGLDAEWTQDPRSPGLRRVLSWQMSVRAGAWTYEWICFPPRGTRFKRETVLSWFLSDLQASGLIDLRFESRLTREERDSGERLPISLRVVLIGFYGIIDITSFYSGARRLRKLDSVRRTVASVERPESVQISHPDRHDLVARATLITRDAQLLAPAGSNLDALGKALGLRKLELPEGFSKDAMDRLLRERPDVFAVYAARDATIALAWAERVRETLNLDSIPITLGGCAATYIRDHICHARGWTTEQFDLEWRGLETKRERVDVGGGKMRSQNKLEPRPSAVTVLPAATQAYFGGRNECFLVGIHDGPWVDLDISSAYPSAMALIPDPDFTVPPRVLAAGELRASDLPTPISFLFGHVEFEFPQATMFPCLPCKDSQGRGLIFPRCGTTWASAPELFLALRMGARVVLLQPAQVIAARDTFGLQEAYQELVGFRKEAERLYGKKSPQDLTYKEVNNSGYGKLAQGLADKRNYSTRYDATRSVGPSVITSAPQAALTTSLVRALVSGSMEELHTLGHRVASVTTDGFLSTASADEVEALPCYGLAAYFRHARAALGGGAIWEVKHAAQKLIMMTTRGGFGVGAIDDQPLPHAGAGFKSPREIRQRDDYPELMAVKFLERNGRLEFAYNALPSPKEYVRADADGVSEPVLKSVSWEYDLKRRPVGARMEKIEIHGQAYEHVSYSTVPWESVQDFDAARRASEPMRGRAITTVGQVWELDRRRRLVDANASSGTRTRGSAARTLARNVLRGLRSGHLIADWYCPDAGTRGRDVCERVGLAFGVDLNVDDWKNAGRGSRNARFALSGAEETLALLGIRQMVGFGAAERPGRLRLELEPARMAWRTALGTTTTPSTRHHEHGKISDCRTLKCRLNSANRHPAIQAGA